MKRSHAHTALTHERCQYRTATGRQCASRALDPSSSYCPRHASYQPTDSQDFDAALTGTACRFLNAQGINHSLAALYHLLASGRISPRRASTLAYISNLLLRSLPAIDKDPCPDAGKDSDTQDRLPKETAQDDPFHRFSHQQTLPRHREPQNNNQRVDPRLEGQSKDFPANAAPEKTTVHNLKTQSTATDTATMDSAVTNSAATENINAQKNKAPESEPQATKPQKIRPPSGISTPTPPPYSFAPQSVAGFRLAARNSLLPAGLRNPNDAAADFDRINPKRNLCNST